MKAGTSHQNLSVSGCKQQAYFDGSLRASSLCPTTASDDRRRSQTKGLPRVTDEDISQDNSHCRDIDLGQATLLAVRVYEYKNGPLLTGNLSAIEFWTGSSSSLRIWTLRHRHGDIVAVSSPRNMLSETQAPTQCRSRLSSPCIG